MCVERHGGRVWAESEGAGKWSRSIVALPLFAYHQPCKVGRQAQITGIAG